MKTGSGLILYCIVIVLLVMGVHNALLRSCALFGMIFVTTMSSLRSEAAQQTANRASGPSTQYATARHIRAGYGNGMPGFKIA